MGQLAYVPSAWRDAAIFTEITGTKINHRTVSPETFWVREVEDRGNLKIIYIKSPEFRVRQTWV